MDQQAFQFAVADRAADEAAALALLQAVSQGHTQWSVVYSMTAGTVRLAMGRRYGTALSFPLRPIGQEGGVPP